MDRTGDEEAAQKYARNVRMTLSLFEEQLDEGPYFAGEVFSLVDATMAPALQRVTWCEQIAPALDMFSAAPKVAAWRDALLTRDSVAGSRYPRSSGFSGNTWPP